MLKKRLLVVIAALILAGQCFAAEPPEKSPLFTYVNQPDSSYTWSKGSETKLENGARCIKIDMTSQTWHEIVWKHELSVIRPKILRNRGTALVVINYGKMDRNLVRRVGDAANLIGMPIAVVGDVPFQPIYGKYEDDLIAHTFTKTLETKDLSWPLLFPMTKSVVRAMDTIQALAEKEWKSPVKGFVVTGASKRGWTTYLTGAVDKRVIGIAPSVYDNLNLPAQMEQHLKVYGKYSEAISDYTSRGLPDMIKTPEGRAFADMIDPYTFRKLLTMPKMILLGTNDQYWTLESPDLYLPDLPGDNHIHYTPNAGHVYIDRPDVVQALLAFTVACGKGQSLPKMTWTYTPTEDGIRLTIRPGEQVQEVRVWTVAHSPSRDFRGAEWKATKLTGKDGVYTCTIRAPEGFCAIFGEAEYTENGIRYTQNTTPRIVGAK